MQVSRPRMKLSLLFHQNTVRISFLSSSSTSQFITSPRILHLNDGRHNHLIFTHLMLYLTAQRPTILDLGKNYVFA